MIEIVTFALIGSFKLITGHCCHCRIKRGGSCGVVTGVSDHGLIKSQ